MNLGSDGQNFRGRSLAAFERSRRSNAAQDDNGHWGGLLRSEVIYVDIGSETDVIGEIPAGMIGIVVDDDVVRIPEPAIDIAEFPGRYAPVPAVEPEAVRVAAYESPAMGRPEAAGEMAVFPGVIEMKALVVAALVMTDPD